MTHWNDPKLYRRWHFICPFTDIDGPGSGCIGPDKFGSDRFGESGNRQSNFGSKMAPLLSLFLDATAARLRRSYAFWPTTVQTIYDGAGTD